MGKRDKKIYPEAKAIFEPAFGRTGLTLNEFGARIEVAHSTVSNYLAGTDRPAPDNLAEILKNLKLSPEEAVSLIKAWNYEPLAIYAQKNEYAVPVLPDPRSLEEKDRYQDRQGITSSLKKIFRQMSRGQTALVYGVPGVGKTTLIFHVCKQPIVSNLFEGGILYAEVGPGASPVRDYLAKWYFLMAGHDAAHGWAEEALKSKIVRAMDDRRVLVLLDNVIETEDLTAFKLEDSRAHFLITSRRKYLADNLSMQIENRTELTPLNKTQSRALLRELLQEMPPDDRHKKAAEVVELCQGVPLMLEWAASAIRRIGWKRFRAEIKDPQAKLYRLSFPTVEKPAHSLLLTLSVVYESLTDEDKTRLHKLKGLLAPGGRDPQWMPANVIAESWGVPPFIAEQNLNVLEDACLVRREEESYTFEPFVAEFLTALIDDTMRQHIREMQTRYLNRLQSRSDQQEQQSGLMLAFFDNTASRFTDSWLERFAALRISADLAQDETGRLSQFLLSHLSTVEYLARYYPSEGVVWARQSFESAGESEPLERAVMAQLYGWLLTQTAQAGEKRLLLRLALGDYERIDDLHGQVACHLALEEKISAKTRRMLGRFMQQPGLNRDDANLLLHAAARLRQQDEAQAEQYFQAALVVYQGEDPSLDPALLRRATGWPVEPFDEVNENRYWWWQPEMNSALYCHRSAWRQLRAAYRPLDESVAQRQWVALPVSSTSEEEILGENLADYGRGLIHPNNQSEATNFFAGLLSLHLYKRFLSSPAALYASLQRRQRSLLAAQQDGKPDHPALAESLAQKLVLDERYGLSPAYEQQLEQLLEESIFETSLSFELEALARLLTQIEAMRGNESARFAELKFRLKSPGKFVVVTRYSETLAALKSNLVDLRHTPQAPLISVDGTLSPAEQEQRLTRFKQSEAGILLTTDTIAPDLHWPVNDCEVIYYDLPWNKIHFTQRLKKMEAQGTPKGQYLLLTSNSWEPAIAQAVPPTVWLPPNEAIPDPDIFNLPGAEAWLRMVLDSKGKRQR